MLSQVLLQATEGLEAEVEPVVESVLWGLGVFLAVLLVGLVLVRGLRRLLDARNPGNPTLVEAVERYTQLLVVVVAVASALVAAGYGHVLSGSALVVAAATLAIGVAGQEVIGNLVSGLFLVADPDFNVGDWIAWEDQEGVVETIRFRVTRVRTPNNEVVTVPNTTLATSVVRRPYSRERFRVVVRLGISMDEDLDEALDVLRAAVDATEGVVGERPPRFVVEAFGDDAAEVRVEFWVADPTRPDVDRTRSDYIREAKRRLDDADITYSPPSEHELSGALRVDREDAE